MLPELATLSEYERADETAASVAAERAFEVLDSLLEVCRPMATRNNLAVTHACSFIQGSQIRQLTMHAI